MTMFEFSCEYCGKRHPANAWNQATLEAYEGDAEILPENPQDRHDGWQMCVHVCPACKAEATIMDCDVDVVAWETGQALCDKYKISDEDRRWLMDFLT